MNGLRIWVLAAIALVAGWVQRVTAMGRARPLGLANILAVTSPDGFDTKRVDAAVGRYIIVKRGSDEDHVTVCTAADIPLGSTEDNSAAAAEDRVSFQYFGCGCNTRQAIASGAIAAEDLLVAADAGKIRKLPAGAGTYYIIGRALTAAADTKAVHYVPSFPVQRVI